MKRTGTIFLLSIYLCVSTAFSQKRVSELTIVYSYVLSSNTNGQSTPILNAVNTIYIKGSLSRSEIISSLFSSSTIHDAKKGTAVILKEVNGQKLLIRMTAENWQERNDRYLNLHFTNTGESKVIAGYKCDKATATTQDGFAITVYYTRDLIPQNKDYDMQFKNLDGLPMEYELVKGNLQIKYTLSSINLNPIPASKFDIPKSGYREMTYEESKNANLDK